VYRYKYSHIFDSVIDDVRDDGVKTFDVDEALAWLENE
jgi:hypothetical protein